jgi:hypothetical protein
MAVQTKHAVCRVGADMFKAVETMPNYPDSWVIEVHEDGVCAGWVML